jgi:hypothetical protein
VLGLAAGVQYLINNFSDFQLASLGSFIIHEGVFFLSGLPYLMMECWGLQKYKIQVLKKATSPDSFLEMQCLSRVNHNSDEPFFFINMENLHWQALLTQMF